MVATVSEEPGHDLQQAQFIGQAVRVTITKAQFVETFGSPLGLFFLAKTNSQPIEGKCS